MKYLFCFLLGMAAMLFWQHGCTPPPERTGGDTTSHTVVIPAPQPDTVFIVQDSIIYRHVYKDPQLVSRLLRERDSLLLSRNGLNDSAIFARLDSIDRDVCDSLLHYRIYTVKAGDSLVGIEAEAGLIGYLDTVKISWKHSIPPCPSADPFRVYGIAGAGLGAVQAGVMMGKRNLFGVQYLYTGDKGYWMAGGAVKIR